MKNEHQNPHPARSLYPNGTAEALIQQKRLNAIRYMRVLLDAQPHMTCVVDPRESRIVDGNRRFLDHFGYTTLHTLSEKATAAYVISGDGEEQKSDILHHPDWLLHILQDQQRYRFIFTFQEEARRFDLHLAGALYHSGVDDETYRETNYIVMSFMEVSDQVRLHKKLLKINQHLQQRAESEVKKRLESESMLLQHSKMAEMGNMVGSIAHQLKQPLSAMKLITTNLIDMIEMDETDEPAMVNELQIINSQVDHMDETITLFRNFFRPDRKRSCFEPGEVIDHTAKLLQTQLRNHGITLDSKLVRCQLNGYANEFMQVTLNLLINAKDAIIERYAKHPEQKKIGTIHIAMQQIDNICQLEIEDNGEGIPADLLPEKLFEPYVTTKGDEGTGIGLNICRFIITQHFHGSITAQNREQGACFTLHLPIEIECLDD